ncbi:TetR/AcrR family transcriptional regulator [Solibacillus sp. FSL R5-0691]|uniref:TetR/AcrR family transcriptional regulator n=1 Tax=Solibacillus sp. FSL R5-0691 TaxID=2921653 RepID=UPI0030D38298
MTKEKIIQAAMLNFSEHGYSGGSLAQIAEEVGIRKQSIYTYFKSKDALYLSISKQAMEAELLFAKEFIAKHHQLPVDKVLLPFLQSFLERFESSTETKFFMRSIFFMPQHLEQQLSEQTYFYLDELERLFTDYLTEQKLSVTANEAAIGFLALLDSLYVEMLYGGSERCEKRLQAGWTIFHRGIRAEV